MAVFITPINQYIYVSAYFQNMFTFGNASDDVRICRYINHILDLFGQDMVISGGSASNITIGGTNVSISIDAGKLIQDKTLIPFSTFTVDMDAVGYFGVGAHVIVYTDFQFNDANRNVSVDPNIFYFKIGIVNSSGNFVGTWNINQNRILMCAYDIDNQKWKQSLIINGNTFSILGIDGKYNYFNLIDGNNQEEEQT
jgi:hypothetical protein